jgi:hypothetical protein
MAARKQNEKQFDSWTELEKRQNLQAGCTRQTRLVCRLLQRG